MKIYDSFTAAAVQAAPIYLDQRKTIAKACHLIQEAASNSARLVVFPEVYVAGYPYWNWIFNPLEGSRWHVKLYDSSVDVPGPDVDLLCQAARRFNIYVVIGVNERSPISLGGIYNTNLIIGPDASIIGRHRKLVPTWAEKLTWTGGDGSSIKVYETEIGPLGTLACGENTNTLARFALLSQGELIHAANYVAFPFTENYDMPEAIRIRAGAHSFEGKLFTVVACSVLTNEIIDLLCDTDEKRRLMSGSPNAFSGIFGPDGKLLSEPLIDIEGIVYSEIDFEKCIIPKINHDIIGHYNRFDIFQLAINQSESLPLRITFDRRPSVEEFISQDEPPESDNNS
jgi:predicted amidohydrolase